MEGTRASAKGASGVHVISRGPLAISVDERGAQLMSVARGGLEYLWQGDARWWERRAPVLFPVVGTLRPGTTSAAGPCPMSRHGFARDETFVVEADASAARADGAPAIAMTLASSARTRARYPYDFVLRLDYALLDDRTVEQRFTVTNAGAVALPFTVGGHPAFNVPPRSAQAHTPASETTAPGARGLASPAAGAPDDERFEDYELRFTRPWTCASPTLTADGLWDFSRETPVVRDAAALPLTHRLFDVDTLLLRDVPDREVTLVGTRSGRGVRVRFPDFPYLGVWSAAGDAPFVALEPWHGCASALDEDGVLEHKRGTITLAPGAHVSLAFTITVLGD